MACRLVRLSADETRHWTVAYRVAGLSAAQVVIGVQAYTTVCRSSGQWTVMYRLARLSADQVVTGVQAGRIVCR